MSGEEYGGPGGVCMCVCAGVTRVRTHLQFYVIFCICIMDFSPV